MFSMLFPLRYQIDLRRQADFGPLYYQWRMAKDAVEPKFIIENIEFEHDPNWNTRFLSIQSAHDGAHSIWRATRIVWFAVGLGI